MVVPRLSAQGEPSTDTAEIEKPDLPVFGDGSSFGGPLLHQPRRLAAITLEAVYYLFAGGLTGTTAAVVDNFFPLKTLRATLIAQSLVRFAAKTVSDFVHPDSESDYLYLLLQQMCAPAAVDFFQQTPPREDEDPLQEDELFRRDQPVTQSNDGFLSASSKPAVGSPDLPSPTNAAGGVVDPPPVKNIRALLITRYLPRMKNISPPHGALSSLEKARGVRVLLKLYEFGEQAGVPVHESFEVSAGAGGPSVHEGDGLLEEAELRSSGAFRHLSNQFWAIILASDHARRAPPPHHHSNSHRTTGVRAASLIVLHRPNLFGEPMGLFGVDEDQRPSAAGSGLRQAVVLDSKMSTAVFFRLLLGAGRDPATTPGRSDSSIVDRLDRPVHTTEYLVAEVLRRELLGWESDLFPGVRGFTEPADVDHR